jgi:DNA-binding Lrp family transcriptional regulator
MTLKPDKIDLKILNALQSDARITNLALSEKVALSPSACLTRVQKLRDNGFIARDIALLSPSKLGPALHALIEITLSNHKLNDHQIFERAIRDRPEVIMAVKVSGRFDYLLAVTTRDMPALNALSDELLEGVLPIAKLVTVPVLDVAKTFSGFPLVALTEKD